MIFRLPADGRVREGRSGCWAIWPCATCSSAARVVGCVLVLSALELLSPRDALRFSSAAYLAFFARLRRRVRYPRQLADLGNVDRALLLLVQPNPTYLTVGAWALAA